MSVSSEELAWLLGDGERPVDASFPAVEVPPDLAAATLAAVEGERSGRRWWWAIGAVAAAAGLALAVQPDPVGDVSQMVPRGVDTRLVVVDLKMAVGQHGVVSRVERGAAYEAGAQLFFRVGTDLPAHVALVRVHERGSDLLHETTVDGELDLSIDGQQLVWNVDDGDSDSLFAVVAAEELSGVEAWLSLATMDGEALCAAASARGWGCDYQRVDVP